MKLLIAEDNKTSRLILHSVCTKWGYDVICVEDGQDAWDIMQQEDAPQLLLLDWEMPRMSGIELCKLVSDAFSENPPYIILLTARNETQDIVDGLKNGANDLIAKPFNNDELKVRVSVGKRMVHLQDELRVKAQRLEKSNQDLEQFAYIASHDLKSPLNAIQKLVGWLKEDCIDVLPKSSLHHIELLENRSERMSNLLNDLLDYARIDKFNFQPEKLELSTVSDNIFSLLDNGENVTLVTAKGELVFPRVPLDIILRNLISNAIKHHDKAAINISISYSIAENMQCISVQDDGPGIPPALFHKALEMFQTLQPRDKVEGSGMGLALVQKIVLHYKGRLTIESDGLRGSKIIILLPIQTAT